MFFGEFLVGDASNTIISFCSVKLRFSSTEKREEQSKKGNSNLCLKVVFSSNLDVIINYC